MIPFQPLNGADNKYGQPHRKISNHPYKEAGIKGFTAPNPFCVAVNFITTTNALAFKWSTLAELNKELCPYPWSHNEEFNPYLPGDSASRSIAPGFYTGLPPSTPHCVTPAIPPAAILAQQIIQSSDKLFFISNQIGAGDLSVAKYKAPRGQWDYPLCLSLERVKFCKVSLRKSELLFLSQSRFPS